MKMLPAWWQRTFAEEYKVTLLFKSGSSFTGLFTKFDFVKEGSSIVKASWTVKKNRPMPAFINVADIDVIIFNC